MNASRREFLRNGITTAAGLGALSMMSRFAEAETASRPNILWIISEDTSPDMACYGGQLVKTPALDKFASEGIRFTNAFVTGPVCSAARSAFMTGMYQTSIGAHNHRSHRRDGYTLPAPVKLGFENFRKAGYYTVNMGKTDWNFNVEKNFVDSKKNWNDRKPGQPFFAVHNLFLTHRKFHHDPLNPIDPDKVKVPPYYPDHPITRRDWANYLESIQVLDREVEKILKQLDDEGLADNTIVFYFGDHGRCHVRGKQWLYEGGIRIPLMIRWPGHFKPKQVSDQLVSAIDFIPTCLSLAGAKVPDYIQGKVFLGKNATQRKYIFAARDRCDGTVDRIRCVRNKQYKYIRNFMPERPYTQFNAYKWGMYPTLDLMTVMHKQGKLTPQQDRFMADHRPAEELYDLNKDPNELHNLAGEKDYNQVLFKMRQQLDDWIVNTDDKGRIPESKEVVERELKSMDHANEARMKSRGMKPDVSPEEYLKYWEKVLFQKKPAEPRTSGKKNASRRKKNKKDN